jgi:AcrR family transcriptional regulator
MDSLDQMIDTPPMTKRDPDLYLAERPDQQAAMASPIRLEILGQFTSPEGASIAEIAERMGRPAGGLYYHFGLLEKAGLLVRVGSRPAGKRHEALFRPVAERIGLATEPGSREGVAAAVKTTASAFRMTQRDVEAALAEGTARPEGEDRNFSVWRMHCRVSKSTLAEINQHLDALYRIAERECRGETVPDDADEYCSVTLALLPLRGRKRPESSPPPDSQPRRDR